MTSGQLREKFLEFFEKNGHKIVPSSSLIPTDQSVLFTTAGMQQFKPYYLGDKSPYGKNVASCQKCFRTSDIEEVGDERHLTFFEMLGNFSFGGYEKEWAIKLAKEFLDSISVKIDYVTFFAGDKDVPEDKNSKEIWGKLGIKDIRGAGRDDNFWGPTGQEGPCGPTTEIYSQDMEIWNIVFNQYYCQKDKSLTKLPVFGVDTGMGLERLAMVSQGKQNVFETDLFWPGIKKKAERIVADHAKAAVFLIADGVLPSNIGPGYILRRILRRAMRYGKLPDLAKATIGIYQDVYPKLKSKETDILVVIQNESEKFEKTLEQGLKEFSRGTDPFILFSTYGFPIEMTEELAREQGKTIDKDDFWKKYKEHQELSRTASSGMFKGGLADVGKRATKYHTATHLLLAALRQILGPEIYQKGSNITAERLRFDFNSQKLTGSQIKRVEDLVNQKIKENIRVEMLEMPKAEAIKIAKISFDSSKYGEIVKVYKIGEFSIELCGGPHVSRTGELGKFKIIKEEASSSGVRRIRAILE